MSDGKWIKISDYAESAGLERSRSVLGVLSKEKQAKYLQTLAPNPLLQVLVAFEMGLPAPAEVQQDFCHAMQEWQATDKTLEQVFGVDGNLRQQLQESVTLRVANTLQSVLSLRDELIEKNEYQHYVDKIKSTQNLEGKVFKDPVLRQIKMLEDASTKDKSKIKLEALIEALLDDEYGPGKWPTSPKSIKQRYDRRLRESQLKKSSQLGEQ